MLETIMSIGTIVFGFCSAFYWWKSSKIELPEKTMLRSLGGEYVGDATDLSGWASSVSKLNTRAAFFAAATAICTAAAASLEALLK